MMRAGRDRNATTSTERGLRDAVAALMRATGETQQVLADGIGTERADVTRKQGGSRKWSLQDLHYLAAHYEMAPSDLLCGMDHAVRRLPAHRRADTIGGTQTTIPSSDSSKSRTRS